MCLEEVLTKNKTKTKNNNIIIIIIIIIIIMEIGKRPTYQKIL